MSIPRSTVRLQVHGGFTLYDACEQVDYFAGLGISHYYLSPISQARPGSAHGYDVVDHSVVGEELGGEKALRCLAQALRKRDMGLILDIVPNHMATHRRNRWWWAVLQHGRHSEYAHCFDIDWQAPGLRGKVLAPFLARPYGESLRDGSLRVAVDEDSGSPVIEACGAHYPIAAGTLHAMGMDGRQAARYYDGADAEGRQRLHDLLERQHYRLAWWRCAADCINWRRFFEISDLIGVRVEQPAVFDAVHALPLRLYAEGVIDGLRIDHVDGLADPAAYCRRLRAALQAREGERPEALRGGPAWLVVEKILAPAEALAGDWRVDGTSGYDFMEQAGALLHDPRGEPALTQEWVRVSGDARPVEAYVRDARALMLRRHFVAERRALLHRLVGLAQSGIEARDWSAEAIGRMLDEILLDFPHYRSYAGQGGRSAADARLFARLMGRVRTRLHPYDRQDAAMLLDWLDAHLGGRPLAAAAAPVSIPLRELPPGASASEGRAAGDSVDEAAIDAHLDGPHVAPVGGSPVAQPPVGGPPLGGPPLGGPPNISPGELQREAVRRFQQLTPPLAAKSLEDTVFYRYGRLLSRNEVGADPAQFSLSVDGFHQQGAWRAAAAPQAMLATATHDHKRGEDARARLAVLSEIPAEWLAAVARWEAMATGAGAAPAAAERYMLYQTMVAAWPPDLEPDDEEGMAAFGERLKQWQTKALREAKQSSSWVEPDLIHERKAAAFIGGMMPGGRGHAILADMAGFVRRLAPAGAVNSLAQAVLRLSMPGVPDLYQGTEFWDFSLVDPDNRRPVDFKSRRDGLQQLSGRSMEELLTNWKDGRIKQAVLARAYALRAAMPEVFAHGSYQPLAPRGAASGHAIAYARRSSQGAAVFVLAPLRCAAGIETGGAGCEPDQAGYEPRITRGFWRDTHVVLPDRYAGAELHNALTGGSHRSGEDGRLMLADVLSGLPVAMLRAA